MAHVRHLLKVPGIPAALLLLAFTAVSPASADPVFSGLVAGDAETTQLSPGLTKVDQRTNFAIIEWQSFNLAQNERVDFVQPASTSVMLNRILGPGASMIDGVIDANGIIVLSNADGVMIGPNATIDVHGLLATSMDIDNAAFMAADYNFDRVGAPDAAIINQGTVTAANAGMIAFVAPNVQNSGILRAALGVIELASGEAFTIDFFGDSLITFAASAAPGSNTGAIEALSGSIIEAQNILMTASAARNFVNSIINVEADLVARGAAMSGGKIVLTGGDQTSISVDALLDAGGTPGGEIIIDAGNVDISAASVLLTDAAGNDGDGGNITVGSTAQTDYAGLASANPGAQTGIGGDVSVTSQGILNFTGDVENGTPPRQGAIDIPGFSTAPPPPPAPPPDPIDDDNFQEDVGRAIAEIAGSGQTLNAEILQWPSGSPEAGQTSIDATIFEDGDDVIDPGEDQRLCLYGVAEAACRNIR